MAVLYLKTGEKLELSIKEALEFIALYPSLVESQKSKVVEEKDALNITTIYLKGGKTVEVPVEEVVNYFHSKTYKAPF